MPKSPEIPMSMVAQGLVDDPRVLAVEEISKSAREEAYALLQSDELFAQFDPRTVAAKPRTCQAEMLENAGVL